MLINNSWSVVTHTHFEITLQDQYFQDNQLIIRHATVSKINFMTEIRWGYPSRITIISSGLRPQPDSLQQWSVWPHAGHNDDSVLIITKLPTMVICLAHHIIHNLVTYSGSVLCCVCSCVIPSIGMWLDLQAHIFNQGIMEYMRQYDLNII